VISRPWPVFQQVGRAVAIAVLVSACSSPTAVSSGGCPVSKFRHTPPLVIAHASSEYFGPQNSIEMMKAAVAAGADVVDADVRVTADGVLVARHDDTITGANGTDVSIAATTFAELRTINLATDWAGPNADFPLIDHMVKVPTVEEILNAFPHRLVSLEFKTTGGEKTMCTLLRRLKRTGDVYIGSAGDAPVDTFRPICPEVVTTVTDAMVVEMQTARANPSTLWCSSVPIGQPPFTAGGKTLINPEFVAWDHAHGLAVFTWTIDDESTLTTLATSGVDAVYTGRADIARRVFDTASATPRT
jgi:glycerophosphoryl diester phosphodiesterase